MAANNFKVVLIAGATGTLGKHITEAFLAKKVFEVKVLVRNNNNDEKKQAILNDLKAKGAVFVEGSLEDAASLKNALKGVDLVVSALSGPAFAHQITLAHAAKEAGVKRFVPSEFGGDVEAPLDHGITIEFFQPKQSLRTELRKIGLEHVLIITGFFYEYLPGILFDLEKGTITVGGDGNQIFTTTLISDIAKVVPDIATHPDAANKLVFVEGSRLTVEELAKLVESISGKKLERHYVPIEQLKTQIAAEQNPYQKFFSQLRLLVGEGLTAQKETFSQFTKEKLTPLKDFLPNILKK